MLRILLFLGVALYAFAPKLSADSKPAPTANTLAAIVASMQPGEWRQIPNTKMSAVFPPREGHPAWGVSGPIDVIRAWGGAALDTKRNAMIFNGGGHSGYGGNEVYVFWLDTLKWERLTDPSPMVRNETVTADGRKSEQWLVVGDVAPISTHTYGSLIYLPNVDRIMRSGGADWRSGWSTDSRVWLFDVDARKWAPRAKDLGGLRYAAFDPVSGKVISITSQSLKTYDPVTDSVRAYPLTKATDLTYTAALDPINRWFIAYDISLPKPRPGVYAYKLTETGAVSGPQHIRTRGASEFDGARGWDYDSKRKRIVAWNGGRETAYLDTETWTWSRFRNQHSPYQPTFAANDVTKDTPHYSHFFGRWRYVPKYDVFISYNNPLRDVLIWKPQPVEAGDVTPPPPPYVATIAPILQSLWNGQTVTLPPGRYPEAAAITASNVVIRAHGVLLENTAIEDKAALVIRGNNVTIEGLECAGIRVEAGNGGCVRLEGSDLTLRRVRFRDSQSGLMSWNRDSGTVLIEDSRFERLGRAHGVYIGRGSTHLVIRRSSFLSSTAEGHEIKSRAAKNTIEYNVIASLDGVDSRLIDLPEGGENIIRRNVLAEGPSSVNQDLIGIGLEGQKFLHPRSSTVIEDNIIIMERRGANVLLHEAHVARARIERNKVIGGQPLGGTNTWFANRAAAGLSRYPALPQAH
jgi:hypothetical protein